MKNANRPLFWLLILTAVLTVALSGMSVFAQEDPILPSSSSSADLGSSEGVPANSTPVTTSIALSYENMQASGITYGQALSESKLTGTAKAGSETVAGSFSWSDTDKTAKPDAGTHTYQATFRPTTTPADTEYTNLTVSVSVDVAKRTVTVTPKSGQGKVYGATDPELTYDYSVAEGMPQAPQFTGTLSRDPGENAGNYAIEQGRLTVSEDYTIHFTSGVNFTISRLPITVSPTAGLAKTYRPGTPDPDPALTFRVLRNSDGADLGNVLTGSLSRAAGENAGSYPIGLGTVTNAGNPNYDISISAAQFTINALPVTVTPKEGQWRYYVPGSPAAETIPVEYDVSVSAGYDAAAVKKELGNLSCSVGPGAGSYAITKDGFAANANYTVDFVGKNYEVRALPVTVTPNANQKKTYGDADPAAYGYSVSADLSADLLAKAEAELGSGLLTRESGNTVKTYPFKLNGSYPNYVIRLQSGSFEIVKREVTLNLLSASKPYDGTTSLSLSHLSYSFNNMAGGDTLRLGAVSGHFSSAGSAFQDTQVTATLTSASLDSAAAVN
ncbi:MAG: MBG domain-containing protein, partial [Anaerotruncus rubiinfantis]